MGRLRSQLELYHWVRIDHFRGFEAYWEIPADSDTAMQGRWVKAPGEQLLETALKVFDGKGLPLVAEDLGIITPEVEALRDRFALPGMKILQFAFDSGPSNPYLPHNHPVNSVVYTGTHDNDTSLSWFENLSQAEQETVYDYLGSRDIAMPWALIRSALASEAKLAMLPMQDILGLGQGHRMNTPGTTTNNWRWSFNWDQLTQDLVDRIGTWIRAYDRHPDGFEASPLTPAHVEAESHPNDRPVPACHAVTLMPAR
jgi:4-alpha-glucanotransferase